MAIFIRKGIKEYEKVKKVYIGSNCNNEYDININWVWWGKGKYGHFY